MALPIVIAKNQTGSPIELNRLGITIAASPGQETLTDTASYIECTQDEDLIASVASGDIIINDGAGDLSVAEGVVYLESSGNLDGPTSGAAVNVLLKLSDSSGNRTTATGVTIDGSNNLTTTGTVDAGDLLIGGSTLVTTLSTDFVTVAGTQTVSGSKTFSGITTYSNVTNYNAFADFGSTVTFQGAVTVDGGSIDMDGNPLTNVATPSAAGDAANKSYVDSRSIDDLTDVDTTTLAPSSDDLLRWNGSDWVPLKNNQTTTDPTVTDDSTIDYSVGSTWINTTTDSYWVCVDNSSGAAVWKKTTAESDDLASVTVLDALGNSDIPLTWTDLNFGVTLVENNTSIIEHDNTNTDRIQIKETGLYMISWSFECDDELQIRIREDDTTVIAGPVQAGDPGDVNDVHVINARTQTVELTSGTYLTVQIQAATAAEALMSGGTFSVTRMQGSKGDKGDAGSGTITVEDEGISLGSSFDTINFVGSAVTATDAGSGEATVTITAGTGDVTSASNITDNRIVRGDGGAKGVQESLWSISDTGVLSISSGLATPLLSITNTTDGGDFAVFTNDNSNDVFQFNTVAGGNASFSVLLDNGNAGLSTESGYAVMGPTATGIDTTVPLTIEGVFSDAWTLAIQGGDNAVDTASNGLKIMAGEYDGDIALHIRDVDDSFGGVGGAIMEVEGDNGYVTLYKSYAQTLLDNGIVHGLDLQGPGVTSDVNTQFGIYRIAGERANIAISAYDNAGGQTFTTTATTINLDSTLISDTGYTLAADQITVANAGRYEVSWSVSLENSGSTSRSQANSWVENNTVEIQGTRSEHYLRQTNFGATGGGTVILDLAASDVIRLRAARTNGSGTCLTRPDGSRLTIKRLS